MRRRYEYVEHRIHGSFSVGSNTFENCVFYGYREVRDWTQELMAAVFVCAAAVVVALLWWLA